ncbi:MAG: sigma-70 family RNA polymerase sigma factor [Lachnospiraceae bacterium]|nr:sigma-70 family RNA polymerase sigma factor [Lachnospiraceae bacterium]
MEDSKIIDLYFERNEKAIDETDIKYGKLCHNIALNILCSIEDSKECVNDTYLGVWNKIPPVRPSNLMAFVCKITKNLALKRLDYNKAQKRDSSATVSFDELNETIADTRDVFGEEDIEKLSRMISDFLSKEKEDSRNIFIRRYWFFDSVSDIAKRYLFSESKVKSSLFNTRNRLRAYLEKEGLVI